MELVSASPLTSFVLQARDSSSSRPSPVRRSTRSRALPVVTIGISVGYQPRLLGFTSYVLCLVQTLENVVGLDTGFLIPSPPPPTRLASPMSRYDEKKLIHRDFCFRLIAHPPPQLQIHRDDDARWPHLTNESLSLLPTKGLYIFARSEPKQATNGYDKKLLLSEDGGGKVSPRTLSSGQCVSIKRICREKKLSKLYREVEILAKLRHKNLTTLVGYRLGDYEHALVYEYTAGGTSQRRCTTASSWDVEVLIYGDRDKSIDGGEEGGGVSKVGPDPRGQVIKGRTERVTRGEIKELLCLKAT